VAASSKKHAYRAPPDCCRAPRTRTNGLYSNPALALLAGIAIVIMAIALDRATSAIAERTDPTRRHLIDEMRRKARLATLATDSNHPDEFETSRPTSLVPRCCPTWLHEVVRF
jgi:hypothetical protein